MTHHIIIIFVCLVVWYVLTLADYRLNGGMKYGKWAPFVMWFDDIVGNLPLVGMSFRMYRANDDYMRALMYPGVWYTVSQHIILPFGYLWWILHK